MCTSVSRKGEGNADPISERPGGEKVKVELHSHTCRSRDCLLSYDAIIRICRQRGIGALAVTDHNEIEGAFALRERAPFTIIVGEEIFSSEGEIIGLFLERHIPRGLSPEETVARIKEQGGLVLVPHPFDSYRRGAIGREVLDRIRPEVDLIEILNARNLRHEDDASARAYAAEHGLTVTAGSDAHSRGEFGTACLEMEPFDGPADFLAKARRATIVGDHSSHLVHLASSYAKLHKRVAKIGRNALP